VKQVRVLVKGSHARSSSNRLSDLDIFAIACSQLETAVDFVLSCLLSYHPLALYLHLMGNAPIAPRERHNLPTIPEVSSSQDEHVSEITRATSINAIASELESTQDESARYLPKRMNRSSNGVIMPSKPYGCGGASTVGGIESPQWGWYISISPSTSDMYHCGSRTLHDSSANATQTSSGSEAFESSPATSHQPNRIFEDMHKKKRGASIWSSIPL
jgi:hypothetical protein